MSDGWLFRLRSNLGSRYVAPAWPSGDQRVTNEPGAAEENLSPDDARFDATSALRSDVSEIVKD